MTYSDILIWLKGWKSSHELIVRDDTILVLVQALEKQAQTFLTWIHIRRFQELMQIIMSYIPFVLCIYTPKSHVQLDGAFINNSLTNKLDWDLTLDEASQEPLQ